MLTQDGYIERFVLACEAVQEGNIPPRIGLANMETELRARYLSLTFIFILLVTVMTHCMGSDISTKFQIDVSQISIH